MDPNRGNFDKITSSHSSEGQGEDRLRGSLRRKEARCRVDDELSGQTGMRGVDRGAGGNVLTTLSWKPDTVAVGGGRLVPFQR